MNQFLKQFYEIPVDANVEYLQRIFFCDYQKFADNVKTSKTINRNSGQEITVYLMKDGNIAKMSVLKNESHETATIDFMKNDIHRIIYKKLKEKAKNEYLVHTRWIDGREMFKWYAILNYNNEERILLKKTLIVDHSKDGTDEYSEKTVTLYSRTKKWLNKNYQIHRENGPAIIVKTTNSTHVIHCIWYHRDKIHRVDLPAEFFYDHKNRVKKISYYRHGKRHNMTNAAEMYYDYAGQQVIKIWYQNDEIVTTKNVKMV